MSNSTIKNVILRLRKVNHSLSAKFLSGVLLLSLFFSSCKKENTDIGLNQLGDQLKGVFTDTMTVITHTKLMKPLKTGLPAYLMCGDYFDPVFGSTQASFYSEIYPRAFGSSVDFGTPQIDSVVLSLVYKGYYGRPAPLHFKVYEVSDTITNGISYYSTSVKPYNSAFPLADVILEPNTLDSVHADGQTYAPQLRIKLDKNLLSGLAVNSLYTSWTSFRSVFNGIYVEATATGLSGNRAIYSFVPGDAHTKVTLYYHNLQDGIAYTFDYLLGGNTGRFNHFNHDYSTAAPSILTQVNDTDINQESTLYIQGLGGLQTKLYIPHLFDLQKNGPVAINKAEIVLKADPNTLDDYYLTPTQLVMVALDDTDGYLTTSDLLEGNAYGGGTYDATNKEYHFNIARYLQQVLYGSTTFRGLMIIPQGGAVLPNRVVLGGGSVSSPYRIKLNLTYTKL